MCNNLAETIAIPLNPMKRALSNIKNERAREDVKQGEDMHINRHTNQTNGSISI